MNWLWFLFSETPALRDKVRSLEGLVTALKCKCEALETGVKLSDQIAEELRKHNTALVDKCDALERNVNSLNELNLEQREQIK